MKTFSELLMFIFVIMLLFYTIKFVENNRVKPYSFSKPSGHVDIPVILPKSAIVRNYTNRKFFRKHKDRWM